ncbi:MAG: ornithine cyclodeaminase family protein [Roseitalea sp.]|jgi:ornithine cyclodeaminase|nr:ornithine cyclodeaminase family protein [Roseitalea sp.]MBO6722143.1 ornithine cyclodeaminase family protein [Roseitalea sp.]MBO6744929.1 ornithine cyclodeaminase family protein [Roseitalea sp.]
MKIISADDVDEALDFPALTDALADAFKGGVHAPPRHHHTIANAAGADQTLLLMPAWNDRHMAVKLATVTPDNGGRGLPAVMASVILMDKATGEPVALIDGARLTLWRTAAASALAARHLAPPEPDTLLMVGAGALAPFLVRAHLSVRPYRHILAWNRNVEGAERLAQSLRDEGHDAQAVAAESLDAVVSQADVISCATLSTEPLIKGAQLKPGTHIDLVGAFTPHMRESDDDCVQRATLFVDTYAGALHEGGDLVQPISAGLIERSHVRAELMELVNGDHPGRAATDEITLFKSTGASLEDLAAASLIAERCGI